MIKMANEMAGAQSKYIEIANKLTLGMARTKNIKKDVFVSAPACLPHLPATSQTPYFYGTYGTSGKPHKT
jgi:hypothetical protein